MTDINKIPAIVYCEDNFNKPNGKTAHGLVRFTQRYHVRAVIDSHYAGRDAGEILDGKKINIPVVANLSDALKLLNPEENSPIHLVIGIAPDGGKLNQEARTCIKEAIQIGLHIDCGLHDFLSDDIEIAQLARKHGVQLRDIRKPPDRKDLHFFSGKIEQVKAFRIALLGTDSAVGKRTTAWLLVQALQKSGWRTEMVGTGQTAWMQGAQYGIILDSLVNDFLSGEIEHVIWRAWNEVNSDILVIEGQGSLLNPAYPGGFEILAAGRPDVIVLQHAPARKDYDGFPGYPIHPLPKQIQAIELISGKPVIAITLNHENLVEKDIAKQIKEIHDTTGLPTFDVLKNGADELARLVISYVNQVPSI
jgi:uncharacterized NAD-dependent epimerase/dehydratase family protein